MKAFTFFLQSLIYGLSIVGVALVFGVDLEHMEWWKPIAVGAIIGAGNGINRALEP